MTTGLFLGAGASCEIGMPLVGGLTAEFKAYWTPARLRQSNAVWRAHGGGFSDVVIDEVCSVLIRPEMTYENILGYIETQFVRHRPDSEMFHGLYSLLITIVYAILWSRHVQLEPFMEKYLRYLDGIVGLANENSPLWIFTLNHDLVVECVALSNNVPVTCGLTETQIIPRRDSLGKKIGVLSLEVLQGDDLASRGLSFYSPGEYGINLLKVHGGVDLFTIHDGKDLARIHPEEPSPKALIAALRASHDDMVWIPPGSGARVTPPNEEAFEDDDGQVQFLRHTLLAGAFKFDSRHQQTLPAIFLPIFRRHLESLERLICIGYGFGDAHINTILREWLEVNPRRYLEAVAPSAKVVPDTFGHLSPQVQLAEMTTTDFLRRYSPTPLSHEEIETKRSLDIQRRAWS